AQTSPLPQLELPLPPGSPPAVTLSMALWQLLKLAAAAVLGLGITVVHKHYHRDKPLPRSLEQAQVLLCVAGALMMLIIGDSVARAFGVAGAASIIRFRTPVEDPKDTTLLFLLLGVGMACGLGAYWMAGLGSLFLCVMLVLLDRFGERKARTMMLEVVASGAEFPSEHVHRVLGATADFYEAREVAQGDEASVRYQVTLDPGASLSYLSQQLMSDGTAGVKSVAWEAPKRPG
ncbi:MAG: DUF4956 domain-containing protein, partial [Burkholderiales bacterium]